MLKPEILAAFLTIATAALCALIFFWVWTKVREAKVVARDAQRKSYMDEYHRLRLRNRSKIVARISSVQGMEASNDGSA